MSRPASRRGLLAGIMAAPVAAPIVGAASVDPAEAAFLRWLDHAGQANATRGLPDDDPLWTGLDVVEDAFLNCPPSPAKAVTLALHELSYLFSEDRAATVGELFEHDHQDVRFPMRMLLCLRGVASGEVGRLVEDVLSSPDRPVRDTALHRAYCGERRA